MHGGIDELVDNVCGGLLALRRIPGGNPTDQTADPDGHEGVGILADFARFHTFANELGDLMVERRHGPVERVHDNLERECRTG